MNRKQVQLKAVLERLYNGYNHRDLIKPDPLQFVYNYSSKSDMEISAFLAASLAYGNVRQIERKLTDLLARMGDSPCAFVRNFDGRDRERLKDFKHRFSRGDDISDLLGVLKAVFNEYGGLEKSFLAGYKETDENIIPALCRFCDFLIGIHIKKHPGPAPKGLRYLLASPVNGSACKRMNLFLRWMVRSDAVDTGLWSGVDKAKLIVPVDIHMGRLCKILGLYEDKRVSLSSAVAVTSSFKSLEPSDPVKYDFALSRVGIVQSCKGGKTGICENCELLVFCGAAKNEI